MVKLKSIYICSKCSEKSPRWAGQCSFCKEWNCLIEDVIDEKAELKKEIKLAKNLSELAKLWDNIEEKNRIKSWIWEFDRVLWGWIVWDSLVLLTWDPWVWKSTLTLQVSWNIANSWKNVIYFSWEESVSQVWNRAKRIFKKLPEINFVNTTDVDEIIWIVEKYNPDFVVVDSVNTLHTDWINWTAGSVSQIKACSEMLMQFFKRIWRPLLLIWHVTKWWELAWPQVLAHLVDTVLYLEWEKYNHFKMLRWVKNRFWATSEVWVFEMEWEWLIEVKNPSSIFLEWRAQNMEWSAITVTLEWTRPFVVEIQALASWTNFPYPKRVASWVDLNRLNIINAIIAKHCGIKLEQVDIFLNTIWWFKLWEPAVDLAISASIISSKNKKAIPSNMAFIWELWLSWEIRNVSHLEKRIKELEKLWFEKVVLPKQKKKIKSNLQLLEISSINQITKLF